MKRLFSKLFNTLPKKLTASVIVALAIFLPVSSMANPAVKIEGALGVSNVTAGDTQYKDAVNASYDQVVKIQVFYHNREDENSGKLAENLRVKLNMPTTAGTSQVIRGTISGDNTNTINDQVTVNLDRPEAYLEYIPGSAVWRHNAGTNEAPQMVEQKVSDDIVYGGQGLVLEHAKPCYNFSATVTILARVRVPGVSIDKQVRVKGTKDWSTNNTAKPGETLEYMITYKNMGNTEHKNVVIRDNLPPQTGYVPNTTFLANKTNPSGVKYNGETVTTTGIVIGNYAPGANAFTKFEVKLPEADKLQCGKTEFRNVGVVRPEGMNEYYNTATTTVEKVCAKQPAYSCDMFRVTPGANRTVTVNKDQFKYSASNGATFKNVVINWGDNTAPLTTNNAVGQTHKYASDGTYTITAVAHFTVNGKDVTANGVQCADKVTFKSGQTPPAPAELPKTGAGSVVGLFAATSVAGAAAHRVYTVRRRR